MTYKSPWPLRDSYGQTWDNAEPKLTLKPVTRRVQPEPEPRTFAERFTIPAIILFGIMFWTFVGGWLIHVVSQHMVTIK